jgi:hypothetical protein
MNRLFFLRPRPATERKPPRFKLSNIRPFEERDRYRLGLLDLNFVVLGRAP